MTTPEIPKQETAKRFKCLGVNDDRDFCECCGKQGLQKVVWIEDTETGSIRHFGVVCATRPAKGFDLTNEIKQAERGHKSRMENVWRMAHREYRARGGKYTPIDYKDYSCKALDMELMESCILIAKGKIEEMKKV